MPLRLLLAPWLDDVLVSPALLSRALLSVAKVIQLLGVGSCCAGSTAADVIICVGNGDAGGVVQRTPVVTQVGVTAVLELDADRLCRARRLAGLPGREVSDELIFPAVSAHRVPRLDFERRRCSSEPRALDKVV